MGTISHHTDSSSTARLRASVPLPDATPAHGVMVRSFRTADIDRHTEQLLDWNLRYDQLDRGIFQGGFTDIRWPGLQLFVETTTRRVRQRGHLPAGTFGIGTMLAGDGPMCINGKAAGADTMIAVHSAELDACTPIDCTMAGLVVDADILQAASWCAPELVPLLGANAMLSMTVAEPSISSLRTLMLSVVRTATERPAVLDDEAVRLRLLDDLMLNVVDAMAGAQRSDEVHRPDARKRLVDRACDLMLARADEPPTLLEVCNRVGASPRKLGYCFQGVLGVSPARYIKAVRLNAVRRELSRCENTTTSVYDVAARWGFWHFGHFSADYKKQFSELPSNTLRRARSR